MAADGWGADARSTGTGQTDRGCLPGDVEPPRDDAQTLAERLGISEEAVREAWDRLSGLSLVQYPADGPTGSAAPPRAVSPEVGLEYLLAQRQAEFALESQRIAGARAVARQLISEYEDLRPVGRRSAWSTSPTSTRSGPASRCSPRTSGPR
ncbi:hypothetical protein WKI68_20970 [Streptomyces sp. MS1.HAVA.3]|uniref:HTH gntR-type domain-containing protein n=1 Tax=Streptomyces caledonius TaxID=3134107 RepID=A0ABU8U5P2_9ACTN